MLGRSVRRQVNDDRDARICGRQLAEPDFDRKFSAVAAPAEEVLARRIEARRRPRQEIATAVCFSVQGRHDQVEGFSDELPP